MNLRAQSSRFLGLDDYKYDPDVLARALGIEDFMKDDEKLKNLSQEFGSSCYLTERRKREVILKKLSPFLGVLPPTNNDEKQNRIKKFLIDAGFCTASGVGIKGIDDRNWDKRGSKLKDELQRKFKENERREARVADDHGGREAEAVKGWLDCGWQDETKELITRAKERLSKIDDKSDRKIIENSIVILEEEFNDPKAVEEEYQKLKSKKGFRSLYERRSRAREIVAQNKNWKKHVAQEQDRKNSRWFGLGRFFK